MVSKVDFSAFKAAIKKSLKVHSDEPRSVRRTIDLFGEGLQFGCKECFQGFGQFRGHLFFVEDFGDVFFVDEALYHTIPGEARVNLNLCKSGSRNYSPSDVLPQVVHDVVRGHVGQHFIVLQARSNCVFDLASQRSQKLLYNKVIPERDHPGI